MTTKEILIFCFLAGAFIFYKIVGGRWGLMFLLGLAIGVTVGMFLGIVLVALLKANDDKEVYYYQIDEEWVDEEWDVVIKTRVYKKTILLKKA